MKNTIIAVICGMMMGTVAHAQSWMGGAVSRDDSQLMSRDEPATTQERSQVASFETNVANAEAQMVALVRADGKSEQEAQFAQTVAALMVATSGMDNRMKETESFGKLKAVAKSVVTNFLDQYAPVNGVAAIEGDLTNLQTVFDRLNMGSIEDASASALTN